jgi:hypothetical protein
MRFVFLLIADDLRLDKRSTGNERPHLNGAAGSDAL